MNLIKPERLKPGDKIGLIALSGAIEDRASVERAVEYFKLKGCDTVLSDNIYDTKRYLAGDDDKKVDELHRFFKDESIRAIVCIRGGYGAIRLVNKINYDKPELSGIPDRIEWFFHDMITVKNKKTTSKTRILSNENGEYTAKCFKGAKPFELELIMKYENELKILRKLLSLISEMSAKQSALIKVFKNYNAFKEK